ncbi:retrovirus-related pol polyprotein from transposon TNT 1-94 [Tanacetum coccineum]
MHHSRFCKSFYNIKGSFGQGGGDFPEEKATGNTNIKQCLRKVADGHFTAAVKVLSSSGVAPYCDDTIKALEAKHPYKPPPSMPSIIFSEPPLVAKIDSVFSCIKSFPKGTSCRRDGLRAQHILDALCGEGSATATDLLKVITSVVNLWLAGRLGTVWRRLVSKVAMKGVGKEISKYLSDFQFGVGVSSGAEAILHSVNRVLSEYQNDGSLAMLTVDFSNTFNLADRSALLHEAISTKPSKNNFSGTFYQTPVLETSGLLLPMKFTKGIGYDNQRTISVARARENTSKRVKHAAYHMEKLLLCKQEEAGFQLNAEQADWRDDHNTSTNWKETVDQDDDDLAKERDLLASLIDKIKCEIDDSKNRNKLLESSNKTLVNKLKGCYNDNLALMLAPASDETIRLAQESRSKLSDLIRPFNYNKLNNLLYDVSRVTCEKVNHLLIEIILFIVDSRCSKYITGNLKLLSNFVEKFLGMVKFRNDQIALILGYEDLVQETITIKKVYYVEGLSHNLFSVGQFYDADLEVAFRKSTCYICDLKGNDLLTGSRGTNLYSITLQEITSPNPIFLMAKARSSQVKIHQRSSLFFFPMRVESINGKKYVLVIVDDYSRYTWTHFLRSKDETPGVLIDFLTLVQRGLHAQVTTVQTDKGTEFLNKTLHAYFAKEGIRHETSTARTPEQNGVVERRNRTLVEAARTMLSAAKVPLFFWAEAIATACFTQNRSLIVRDGENLDKMKEKGDACIFVGYSTQSKAYRVFNKRTRMIVETIHVNFDELPQMASDHVSGEGDGVSNWTSSWVFGERVRLMSLMHYLELEVVEKLLG